MPRNGPMVGRGELLLLALMIVAIAAWLLAAYFLMKEAGL